MKMARTKKIKSPKILRDAPDPLDYPETRIERYLKCIKTGDNTDLPSTVNTRIERYLYCIATGNNATLPNHPETMIEVYLDAIATGNVSDLPHDPQDRLQRYLYAISYVDSSLLPSADYTRIEKYISSILGGTTFVTEQAPYLFRVSGGEENANVKHKELDTLVGATMAWNQMVDVGTTEVTIPSGHKYYAIISGTTSIGASTGTAISVTGGTDILTDLTLMLGPTIADYVYTLESGTAGAGLAWLKSYGFFTKPYYAYDAGSLQSVCVSAHKMTGFNQWDEEWEGGGLSSTGAKTPNASAIRSKNYIPVLPSTTYYLKAPKNIKCHMYDANKVWINGLDSGYDVTRTTAANCHYIRFYTSDTSYGTTYKNDICINLSQPDTSVSPHNGEYEPYKQNSYPLDHSTDYRGVYKLDANTNLYADGDTYAADGTATRYFTAIDLGTLNWNESTPENHIFRDYYLPNLKAEDDNSPATARMSQKYIPYGYVPLTQNDNKCFALAARGSDKRIVIVDHDYSSVESFKAAVSGIYLLYPIATPTTSTVEPFTNPQQVDRFGTEEYVDFPYFVEDRDVEVPVGHVTQYPQ